jgi:hypothetical protein
MGAYQGTGNLLDGGRGATIGGVGVAHSTTAGAYYYQRGILIVPTEAEDELLAALTRSGIGEEHRTIAVHHGFGMTEIRYRSRRRGHEADRLVEELGGTIPVEPGYILFPATHIGGFAARRPVPAPPRTVPSRPRRGRGKGVNIGVVDLGFYDPAKAGHPRWAVDGVVLDTTMPLPDPAATHYPFVGHGNAIVGILKQLAPEATVYTGTIESRPSDAPGGTSDRLLAEAISRLLCTHRIHILVVPFGGATRLGAMPMTERALEPYLDATLVIASAGNDGIDPTVYPAVDPAVVGVGAWAPRAIRLGWLAKGCESVLSPASPGRPPFAPWSNRGIASQLGAVGVAVPAPFVTAKLAITAGTQDPPGTSTLSFSGWGLFTGTSFAAPVAAGCIAGAVGGDTCPTPEALRAAAIR